MVLSFCMLIMQIRSFVCLLPAHSCWPLVDWRIGAIVLAAANGCSIAGPRGPWLSQMFSPLKNFIPMKFMLAVGAYLWRSCMPHLLQRFHEDHRLSWLTQVNTWYLKEFVLVLICITSKTPDKKIWQHLVKTHKSKAYEITNHAVTEN